MQMAEATATLATPGRPQQLRLPSDHMQQEERLPPLDLDVLSPLTLRFRDAAAEAQYDSDRTKLWALADVWYKRLGLVVVVFFVAFNADSFRVCFWPVAHMQGLVVLHTALQHYLGPERFAAWRTFITVPIRLSGQVATLSLMASLAPFKGPRWHLVIAAASLFQGLRFVGGQSTAFRTMALLHAARVAIKRQLYTPVACQAVAAHPEAAAFLDTFTSLLTRASNSIVGFMDRAAVDAKDSGSPFAPDACAAATDVVYAKCMASFTFIDLVFHLYIPLSVAYTMEYKDRMRWYRKWVATTQRGLQGTIVAPVNDELPAAVRLLAYALSLSALCAVTWQAIWYTAPLMPIPPAVDGMLL